MKKIFTLILALLPALPAVVMAQTSGGPDLYGYIWRDSNDPNGPTYNWVDIVGASGAVQVTGLADDNLRGPFAIGFPFHYYWYDLTTFRVGSNGYIAFTTSPLAHPFPTIIPDPTGAQNFLAALATDLTFTDNTGAAIGGAEVWYWTSPGNDSLVITYSNAPFWMQGAPGYSGGNTFQVILSGVDSSITFQYQMQSGSSANAPTFCSIGIENNSGNIGLHHSVDLYPIAPYAIKFYYPSTTTFQVNDASTMWVNNETTGGLFLSANGAFYTLSAQIRNSGNQALAPFNVTSRVVNQLNQNQALNTTTTNALNPGDTQDMTFVNQFGPVTPGTYRHINTTQLTGDATPSNNERQLELQVVDTTQTNILLSFDNGTDAGLGGLSWSGGGGGAGMYFVPPFYPCDLTQVRAYIAANANLMGFSMMVLDDDGTNAGPGTVLDSVYVQPGSVVVGAWNNAMLTSPITIDSGGFYVAWMMGGDGIAIGQNTLAPISNRTFEVLGQASNPLAWADFRYRELQDLMINAYIMKVPVGLNENTADRFLSELYPNPSTGYTRMDFNYENRVTMQWNITDISGKVVMSGTQNHQGGNGTIHFDVSRLGAGLYTFSLNDGTEIISRKLSVIR